MLGGPDPRLRVHWHIALLMCRAPINSLLKLYLGADDDGRYQPIGRADGIRDAFPSDYEEKMRMIAPHLDEDCTPFTTI